MPVVPKPMSLAVVPAAELALVCGVVSLVAGAWLTIDAWRTWRRVRATKEAALMLIDVHRDRLDATVLDASVSMATAAERSARLAADVGELRHNIGTLRWMLGRIPWERERLRAELVALALPGTGRDDDGQANADADDA